MGAFCCCLQAPEEPEDDVNNSNNQHRTSSNGFTDFISKNSLELLNIDDLRCYLQFANLFRNKETLHVPSREVSLPTRETKTEVAQSIVQVEECSVCLEDYTPENPKITMKSCSHYYHLACIYEWMERSNFCPICNRVMEFEESLD